MGALQPLHLALVAMVALIVFGPKKLPEFARGIGEAIREFKKTIHAEIEPEQPVSVAAKLGAPPEVTE
jgi:sec-independent protein translocase protein TatA